MNRIWFLDRIGMMKLLNMLIWPFQEMTRRASRFFFGPQLYPDAPSDGNIDLHVSLNGASVSPNVGN